MEKFAVLKPFLISSIFLGINFYFQNSEKMQGNQHSKIQVSGKPLGINFGFSTNGLLSNDDIHMMEFNDQYGRNVNQLEKKCAIFFKVK